MTHIGRLAAVAAASFFSVVAPAHAGVIAPVPVPEPGVLALIAGGVAVVLVARARRK